MWRDDAELRRGRRGPRAGAAALWGAILLASTLAFPVRSAAGEPLPALLLPGFHGPDEQLADHRGQVVLLHFWATWCAACTREIPSLARFARTAYPRLRRGGLVLLAVSNDVRAEDLDRFLARNPLPFPVFFDSLSSLNHQLALAGVPGTVVIGRDGRILDRLLGSRDWQSPALLARLEGYLAEAPREPRGTDGWSDSNAASAGPGPVRLEKRDGWDEPPAPHGREERHEGNMDRGGI